MQETLPQSGSSSARCPACGAALRQDTAGRASQLAYCPSCGATLVDATGRLATDYLLAGRYRMLQLLARGGMGAVYLAEDTRLSDAQVAVKEMSGAFTHGDTEAFARAVIEFEREAAMLARLRHPHLPRVSDRFEEDGKHFLVMEYIRGQTLRAFIQQAGGRLALDQALAFTDQLCDVLTYLHSQRPPIIYRDLKPANVMIEGLGTGDWGSGAGAAPNLQSPIPNPNLVLIDFGIARFYRPGGNSDTSVYGTLGFAPPEQYGKGQTDARTDIYALGVLLHHMLTGHDPSASPFALPSPRALNPALPAALSAAIERATANDRAERFADIAAFRAALRAPAPPPVLRPSPIELPPTIRPELPAQAQVQPSTQPSTQPPAHARVPIWVFALVAVVLIGAVLAFAFVRRSGDQETGGLEPAATFAPAALAPTAAPAPTSVPAPTEPPQPTAAAALTAAPEPTAPSQPTEAAEPTATPAAADTSLDQARPIPPTGASASSNAASNVDSQRNIVTYAAENAIDGKKDTTWRVDRDGVNQWLQLNFAAEIAVWKIGVIPGYDKVDPYDGTDRFLQNRVVKQVRLEFSDGTTQEASFDQRRDMQFVQLPQAVRTSYVRIVILGTYPPPPAPKGRDFTPIAEVVVEGTR